MCFQCGNDMQTERGPEWGIQSSLGIQEGPQEALSLLFITGSPGEEQT